MYQQPQPSYYGAPPYRPSPLQGTIPGIRPPPMGGIRPPYGATPGGPPLPAYGGSGNGFPPPSFAGPTRPPPMPMYPFKTPTFDSYLCESFFPRSSTEAEDTQLTKFLLERHTEILPSSKEQSEISVLVGKVKQSLDKIVMSPETFSAIGIEEVHEVGSYKKGVMIAKHNVADLLVVLKTLPVVESVNSLGQKIVQDIKAEYTNEVFGCVIRDYGCEIAGTFAVVRVLITILPKIANQLDEDLHLPQKILMNNMAALRHAKWFDENASQSVVKALVRLLKFLKKKHEGLHPLNIWCIEILAHYCVVNTPNRTPLPLALAFRRFFQILSTGMLLPSSPALVDPCDPNSRIHYSLSLEEMDTICSCAQTILRVIIHGGTEQLFAGEGINTCTTGMSIWENVVVTQLEKAYSKEDMEPYYGKEPADTDNDAQKME